MEQQSVMRSPLPFRVHPLLLISPASVAGSRSLVAETTSGAPPLILREPLVWFAISRLPARFTEDEAIRAWEAEPELSGLREQLWRVLRDERLVVEADAPDESLSEVDAWVRHGWRDAAIYHEATRDFPFVRMDEPEGFEYDESLMTQFAEEEPPPPIALQLDGEGQIPLRKLGAGESAEVALSALGEEDRRGAAGLGILLDICSGERERRRLGPLGDTVFKSVPSGGARHPTEVFVALLDGAPETPGLYHYDVIDHRLTRVRAGNERHEWEAATFSGLDLGDPARTFAVVTLATMWERAMWRYRDARSWRAPVMDIGHVIGAYRLVLTRLELEHKTTRTFDEMAVSTLLGFDRLQLTPMCVMSFG